MAPPATTGSVTTEGDDLYYEVRGQGRPLLMIAGGLGDAGIYTFVAGLLAPDYKVITYDRRGQSRSTRHRPQNFEISQQARDAAAVLTAAGESSAVVFGNSSGATIGLEFARSQPHRVQALIAHEPPILRILPDADRWLAFIAGVYLTALTDSPDKALQQFIAAIVAPPAPPEPEVAASTVFFEIMERQRVTGSSEFGMRSELMPVSLYLPDVAALQAGGVPIVPAIGQDSLDAGAFYGRTVPILAEQFGCAVAVLPGHHSSYLTTPRAWTAALREILLRV